jgi:hypothetical protein
MRFLTLLILFNLLSPLELLPCAAYVKYASAQSLGFLDLAANCSFINWKLQLAPSGVSAGSYLLLVIRYSLINSETYF